MDNLQYEHSNSKHGRSNPKYVPNHRYPTDDSDSYENELRDSDDQQKSIVGDGKRLVELRSLSVEHLPCTEELTDSTELPMSRESIGYGLDKSWLSSNTVRNCDFGILVGVIGVIVCFLAQ